MSSVKMMINLSEKAGQGKQGAVAMATTAGLGLARENSRSRPAGRAEGLRGGGRGPSARAEGPWLLRGRCAAAVPSPFSPAGAKTPPVGEVSRRSALLSVSQALIERSADAFIAPGDGESGGGAKGGWFQKHSLPNIRGSAHRARKIKALVERQGLPRRDRNQDERRAHRARQ